MPSRCRSSKTPRSRPSGSATTSSEFLQMIRRHGTTAGVYAHASVGCLHVRPVVNLKTEAGVRQFEAIASASADLVLEFGGALSGEHGDGLVRSCVHGDDVRPGALRGVPAHQAHVRSARHLQSRQDRRRAAAHRQPALRAGVPTPSSRRRSSTTPSTAACQARSRCAAASAPAARRWTGRCARRTWRRGRRRTRRAGARTSCGWRWPDGSAKRGSATRACARCSTCASSAAPARPSVPVGVDVARFKSEFLADYWRRHGTPLRAHVLGHIHGVSRWGSRFAPLSNAVVAQRARCAGSTSGCSGSIGGACRRRGRRGTFARRFHEHRRRRGLVAAAACALQRHVHQLLLTRDRRGGIARSSRSPGSTSSSRRSRAAAGR